MALPTPEHVGRLLEPLVTRRSRSLPSHMKAGWPRTRRRLGGVRRGQRLPCTLPYCAKEGVRWKDKVPHRAQDTRLPPWLPINGKIGGSGKGRDSLQERWRQLQAALQSPYDERIMSLAVPALLTLAADPLLSIVDTMFVGRLGPNELGALGVNTALYSLAFFLFNFLASTTTPLVATAVAAQDKDKAGQVTIQGLILAGVLGISLLGGLVIGQDWFLGVMGADGSMLAPAKEYLVARSFAAPAVLVVLVGTGVLRGLQDMKTPLLITLFANAANLVLDPILIYSFDLGVRGAAVATTAAEWLSAGAYVMVLWRERETLGLDCSYSVAVRRAQADYLPFLQAGGTVLLRTFVLLFTKTFASSVATHLGPVNIAAHQVVAQFWLLHSLTTDSLAVSAQSLVAVALGKGDMRQARGLSDRLLQFGIALGVFWTFFLQAASPVLPSIFTSDGTVATAVYSIAPIATFVLPISSAAYVYDGIFIGAKDFRFLAFSMSSAAVCVCTALFLVEPLGWGLPGVWWCQSGMLILRASILTWRYQQQRGPVPRQISKPVEEGTVAVVDNEELEGSVRR